MKKLLYILASVMILTWGCEPMEDVYSDLDKAEGDFSKNIDITLQEGDYTAIAGIATRLGETDAADFIEENLAFSEDARAADYVPYFLGDKYIALKGGSRANVTFDYLTGNPEYISGYTTGENSGLVAYYLSADDYAAVGGDVGDYEMFFASNPPRRNIPAILETNFPEATEGDRVLAQFKFSEEVSSSPTVEVDIEKADYQMIVDAVNADPERSHLVDSYGTGEYYYGANSYHGNFDTRLSRRAEGGDFEQEAFFDLSEEEGEALIQERVLEAVDMILQEKHPDAQATINGNQVYYIVTYDTFDGSGNTYNVAYVVDDEEETAVTFELVEGPTTDAIVFSTAQTVYDGEYYVYDGDEWKPEAGIFYLSSEAYDEMGEPGNYDNFSSSVAPDDYLPQYLQQQKPYAQLGDKVIVGYKYYANRATSVRASEYVYSGTTWENSSKIVTRSEQFVHNGSQWVFDPTIVFTMASADYQMIVDYVNSSIENGSDYVNSYGTGEYYFGADSYYENFDLRLNQRSDFNVPGFAGLSADDAVTLSHERLTEAVEILLQEKYPDAVTQVNGVDVHYIVTAATYENDLSRGTYEFNFKCVSKGPNPEFELVEGPEF